MNKKLILNIIVAGFTISSCNAGQSANSSPAKTGSSSLAASTTSGNGGAITMQKFRFKVIDKGSRHIANGSLNAVESINNSSIYGSNTQLPSTIGWVSALNKPAPSNCWTYNTQITNQTATGNVGSAYSAKQASDSLNVSLSVSAEYGLFSTDDSAKYSQFSSSQSQAVGAFAVAGGSALAQFQVTGIQPFALTLYRTSPQQFIELCGDQIITSMPVKNQVVAGMSFATDSSSFNREENAKISGSYELVKVGVDVAAKQSGEQSSSNVNINWTTLGDYDTSLFQQAQNEINQCITNITSGSSSCTQAFQDFATSATSKFNADVNLVNAIPNTPTWANYFYVDYSQPNQFQFLTLSQALSEVGESGYSIPAAYKPYIDVITKNVNVLHDLALADSILKNDIAPGLRVLLSQDKDIQPTLFIQNPDSMANIYGTALDSSVNSLSTVVGNCLTPPSGSTVAEECSKLKSNVNVRAMIQDNFTAPYPQSINVQIADTIIATVYALIYDTSINSWNTNSLGHLVWLLDSNQNVALLAISNTSTTPVSNVSWYYQDEAAIQVSQMNNNWWFGLPSVGGVGFKLNYAVDYNAVHGDNTPVTNPSPSAPYIAEYKTPSYPGQTCAPYATSSQGCTYTNIISDNAGGQYFYVPIPSGLSAGIINTVSPSQAPAGYALADVVLNTQDNYVSQNGNVFATLYPWQ